MPITPHFPGLPVARLLPGPGDPGFVQAPCQECGTSLVGFSISTRRSTIRVCTYNLTGKPALDAYVEKLQEMDIPFGVISRPSPTSTRRSTLRTPCPASARSRRPQSTRTEIYVPQRVLDWCDFMNIRVSTPPNDNHDPRQYIDEE